MNKNKITIAIFTLIALSIILSAGYVSAVSAVNLGTSGDFVILSKTGITTTGVTAITGDIGTSPIDSTAITGFGLILDPSTQFSTSSLVTGKVYAADYTNPTPTKMTTAIGNMETAYTDAAGRSLPDYTELYSGDLSGKTLGPGLYKWGTGVLITSDVTLNGSASDVFIFQIAQDLTMGSGAKVLLIGGAQARNIFWQVSGNTGVEIGTTSHMEGNILAAKAIHLRTGATINGRALAQTAVTLDANTIQSVGATPILTIIKLLPTSKNISIGSTQQLNATGFDQFNTLIMATINYTTSNSSVANVSSSGLVTAIDFGSVIINASRGSITNISTINVQANAPVLSYIGSKSVTQGNLLSFIITATSPNNLTFAISGKPATANFTDNHNKTAIFSWISNSSNIGVNNINFSVTDGIKSASESVVITVNSFQAPVTNQINPGNTWNNGDYNVTLNATGSNNATIMYINYSLNGIFGQINGSSGNVLINTSGNNTLTFYAVDNSSNVEALNTIYALLDKTNPNIYLIGGNVTLTVGDVYIDAGATANDSIVGDLTSKINVTNNVNTAIAGTYVVQYNVSDDAGNIVYINRTVIVNNQVITSGNSGTGGTGGLCRTEWTCTAWNSCSNGIQTRTCTYLINQCIPESGKPLESQSCILVNDSLNNTQLLNPADVSSNPTTLITGAVTGTFNNALKSPLGRAALVGIGAVLVGLLGYFMFYKNKVKI
jgi:hypothetical protein